MIYVSIIYINRCENLMVVSLTKLVNNYNYKNLTRRYSISSISVIGQGNSFEHLVDWNYWIAKTKKKENLKLEKNNGWWRWDVGIERSISKSQAEIARQGQGQRWGKTLRDDGHRQVVSHRKDVEEITARGRKTKRGRGQQLMFHFKVYYFFLDSSKYYIFTLWVVFSSQLR